MTRLLCPIRVAIAIAAFLLPSLAIAGAWQILSVNGVAAIGEPQISLERDGAISGTTGCNRFQGSGRFEDTALIVSGPLAVTKMACPGADITAQEDTILKLLEDKAAFTHDPFSGAFFLTGDDVRLELVEAAPSVLDAGFVVVHGLSGPLNIRKDHRTDAPVVTRVLPGTLFRNAGCTSGEGRDWCNIEFIDSSGTTGWAAAEYLQSAPATVRAQQGLFDDIGGISCRFDGDAETALCDYGVARDASHSAVVIVYKPDGAERVLHFADGTLAYVEAENVEEADTTVSSVSDGVIVTTVGGETYEIRQSVIQ